MLVEIRTTGGQTMYPASRHPGGELVAGLGGSWTEPATVEQETLETAVGLIAATALQIRWWRGAEGPGMLRPWL